MAPADYEIRRAEAGDADVMRELVAGFRDHLGASTPTDAELEARLPAVLADPASELCWACAPDRSPLGYTYTHDHASLWAGGLETYLEDLFVVANARGQGVGRSLLDSVVERARARGAVVVSLSTNERNARAQALYARAGFRPQATPLWSGGREIVWSRTLG